MAVSLLKELDSLLKEMELNIHKVFTLLCCCNGSSSFANSLRFNGKISEGSGILERCSLYFESLASPNVDGFVEAGILDILGLKF